MGNFKTLLLAHKTLVEVCSEFESMCCEAHLHHTATEYATAIAFAEMNMRYLTDAGDPYEREVALRIGRNSTKVYEDVLRIMPDSTMLYQRLKMEYETALESIKAELLMP